MQAVDAIDAVGKRATFRTWAAFAMLSMSVGAASGAQANGVEVGTQLLAEGLTAPLALAEPPDGSGRLFVLEQIGRLRVIDADGQLQEQPFLDFQDRLDQTIEPGFDERGALGFAFHPDYAENGKLYIYYSAPLREQHTLQNDEWGTHTSHIAEIRVSEDDPNRADPDYQRLLLEVDQPQFAHNAGTLAFGPKGMLHIALGDGGSAPENGDYPREGTSQEPDNLLGKILRIDVDQANGSAYGIPDDNPFVDVEGYRGEIYAMGFRNPYKIAFDPDGSGRLFAGDVGQNSYEEIDLVEPGGNYGWAIKEASHCFDWDDFEGHFEGCDDDGLIDPIIEYKNGGKHPDEGEGRSTVGGVIYRGETLPDFEGKLIFGDWSIDGGEPTGAIYLATPAAEPDQAWPYERIQVTGGFPYFLLGLAQDQASEVYLLAHDTQGPEGEGGKVFKLTPPN
ncbi:MAG: PQQ-dependent sugar dehydrogenase [Alphaproteobacteria bacterium]|nr:PQQ-dependent sugar dehydrogenase [Alphaproteobacteria bacterium]